MKGSLIEHEVALGALAPAWRDLFHRVPGAPPFVAPAWLLPWWRSFAPGRLFTAAAHDGNGRLAGLAPFYVEHGPLGRRVLPLGIGLSDQFDILIDPAQAEDAGAALVAVLAAHRDCFDLWSIEELPPGAAALRLSLPDGWRAEQASHSPCPVLPLPAGAPADAVVPRGKARKWRMATHRAARREAVHAPVTAETLPGSLAALFALHARRWESRGEPGVLADPIVRRFHEAAAPALLADGLLDMDVLAIDGEPAGVFYGLRTAEASYAYLGGFDPRFAFESPGTVLVGAAIARAVQRGARAFSFLRGEEPYKFDWGAVSISNTRLTVVPAT